jgi:Flp pilus assembly protein TadD
VLHHADLAIDIGRVSRVLDRTDPGPGFETMDGDQVRNVYGWTPGKVPRMEPSDTAWTLEPGTDLVIELHLLHGKTPTPVQPLVALFFTDEPPARTPVMAIMGSKSIDIPAGARDHAIEDSYVLPVDVEVLSVYPHAHYLGKDILVTATRPDGGTQTLIHIPHWDFHWQQDYRYLRPVPLPRGTTIRMRFTYDNTDENDANPHHPPIGVRFGPQSNDEMGNVGIQFLPKSPADGAVIARDFQLKVALANVAMSEMYIRYEPNSAYRRMTLGSSYLEVGRIPDAIRELQTSVRLDPMQAQAHNFLGGALMAARRVDEALVHLREASRLSPDDAHLHYNLGKGLEAAGNLQEAAREYDRAIALAPDFADPHQSLGALLFASNRLPEALGHFRRAVALAPASASAHSDRGGALAQAGRRAEAITALQRALELDPAFGPARDNLARLIQGQRSGN